MADTVGSVEVQITANTAQFEEALARARQLAAGLKDVNVGGGNSSSLRTLINDSQRASLATKQFADENRSLRDAFKEVAGALSVLQGPLGPLAGRFGFLGTLIGRVGVASAGAAVAIGGLALSANEAVDAFADEEKQLLTLEAVLKATSNAAGQTMRSLSDLADAISTTTLATDDQVRSAESLMLTFRKISGEEFPRALRAAQDLAAVGFGSIEGNARQLGRALEDPIRGLGALRRSGVTFSASQREVIRSLVETGQAVQAQREVLKAIEIQVGGAGAAQASGTTGAFHQLSEAVNNVTVVFGKWVVETLKIPEAARAAAAGLNALIDDGEKLKFTIFGYTVETERWVSKAQEAKEATEAATKSNLDYVRSMEKAREIQGQISRGELGGTLAPMQEKDQTQLIREAAERQAQLEKAIQAVNTVIYDAIQAYNVWGAPILAAANKQKELADNILTAHLELTKQRDALFRTSEQQKIYDLLIKNSIPPLSDEAKALAVVSHELNILTDAMQQAGAAGVNMDKLKEKMQSLETASVITGAGGQSPVVNRVKVTIDAIKRQMELEREASAAEASAVTIEDKMNAARLRAQADNNSGLSEEIQLLKEDNAALLVKQNLTISQAHAEASRLLGQQQNLESQQLEIQLVGKSISEQTRLRTELQLTQEGKRRWAEEGIKYTAEVAAADKKYADQVAADAAKLSEANLQAQTNFVTQSMFLSQTEAKVAQAMNEQFGDQWQTHMQDTIAQQIRFNDVLQDTYATTRDFAGTFVDGMMAGKSATDALTDAMSNLQKKLIDMALDAVIQGLFGLLLGSGTAGSNIFSNLVNFTSGGGTGGGTTTTQNPVRRYAEGGVVGSTPRPLYKGEKLQYDEYPAILHAGERVIPASGDDSKSPGISGANMIRMFGGTPKFEGGWGNFGSQAAAMAGAYTAGDTGYGGSGGSWGFTGGSPSGFGDQGSGEYRYSPGSGGAGGPVSIGRGGLTSGAGRLATGPFAIGDAPASGRIGPLRSDVPNRGPLFRWSNPNFNLNPFDPLNPRVDEEFEFPNVDTPFLPPPNLPKPVPTLNTDSEGNVLGTEGGTAGVLRSLLPSNYWNSIRRTFGFHQGGYVGSTPGRARFVDSSIFIGAPRFQSGWGGGDSWSSSVGQTSAPAGWGGGGSNQSYSTTPSSSSGTSLGSGQSSGASYSYNAATYGGGGGGGGTSLGYGQSSGGYTATLSGSGQGTGSSIAYNAATYGGGGGGSGSFTASLGSGTSALSSPFSFATQAAASPTAYRGAFSLGGGFGSAFSALVTGGSTEAFGNELPGEIGDTLGLMSVLPTVRPGTPNLRRGSYGDDVADWQTFFGIDADRTFGGETLRATRAFERSMSALTGEPIHLPSGVIGPQTTLWRERLEQGLISPPGSFGTARQVRTGYGVDTGAPAAGLPGGTYTPRWSYDPYTQPMGRYERATSYAGGPVAPQHYTPFVRDYGAGTDVLGGTTNRTGTAVRYTGPTGQMGYPFAGRPPAYGPGIPTGTTVPFPGSFAGAGIPPSLDFMTRAQTTVQERGTTAPGYRYGGAFPVWDFKSVPLWSQLMVHDADVGETVTQGAGDLRSSFGGQFPGAGYARTAISGPPSDTTPFTYRYPQPAFPHTPTPPPAIHGGGPWGTSPNFGDPYGARGVESWVDPGNFSPSAPGEYAGPRYGGVPSWGAGMDAARNPYRIPRPELGVVETPAARKAEPPVFGPRPSPFLFPGSSLPRPIYPYTPTTGGTGVPTTPVPPVPGGEQQRQWSGLQGPRLNYATTGIGSFFNPGYREGWDQPPAGTRSPGGRPVFDPGDSRFWPSSSPSWTNPGAMRGRGSSISGSGLRSSLDGALLAFDPNRIGAPTQPGTDTGGGGGVRYYNEGVPGLWGITGTPSIGEALRRQNEGRARGFEPDLIGEYHGFRGGGVGLSPEGGPLDSETDPYLWATEDFDLQTPYDTMRPHTEDAGPPTTLLEDLGNMGMSIARGYGELVGGTIARGIDAASEVMFGPTNRTALYPGYSPEEKTALLVRQIQSISGGLYSEPLPVGPGRSLRDPSRQMSGNLQDNRRRDTSGVLVSPSNLVPEQWKSIFPMGLPAGMYVDYDKVTGQETGMIFDSPTGNKFTSPGAYQWFNSGSRLRDPAMAIGGYATGGVVGSTPVAHRLVPSIMFRGAPRFQGGLAADEYPAILHAGETVIPAAGRQRSSTPVQVVVNTPPAAAPNVTVNVMNNSSAQVSTNQSEEGGNFKLDIMIDEMVSSKMRDGGSRISKTLATMGARAQPVRR